MIQKLLAASMILLVSSSVVWAGDDELKIRKQSQLWENALVAGNAAKLGSLYTEDAMLLPPNSGFVRGREAIIKMWDAFLSTIGGGSLEIHEVRVDGDLAYVIGEYILVDQDSEQIDRGKYIEIWTSERGHWHIYRDIWNTNGPPSESASK